ncbi:LLM class flavin-dependent oxidoreductase [Actinophytocola sp.]|uniref:LLM class flavin-dependent oxidoreductase n=1 Tax=Actinophytocola sp. TaxID=1872138 RepID=UPI003D6ACFDD
MQISLTLFSLSPELYAEVAVIAEEAGIESLWLSDHLVTPTGFDTTYPYHDKPAESPGANAPAWAVQQLRDAPILVDQWALISHLSALTSTLRFGSGTHILPLRNPFVTALATATAHRLSQGRLLLGVGSGWMREEFQTVGESFDDRGARLEECIDVIQGLHAAEPFQYHGTHFDFGPAAIGGDPVDVPWFFGGLAKRAIRRTIERGAGWFGPPCSLEESVSARDYLDKLREDSPLADNPLIHYPRLVGEWDEKAFSGYRAAGFDRLVVSAGGPLSAMTSAQERQEAIARLAELGRAVG